MNWKSFKKGSTSKPDGENELGLESHSEAKFIGKTIL